MPVTYPGGGPQITVEALLKMPRLIARQLTNLREWRFVADQIFARGTADQVVGGAVLYQRSESIFPTDAGGTQIPPREVGPRAGFPRAGWAENIFAAMVHKYGLEVPIADEAQRRNALDIVARAQRKLANAIVKFVDTLAMTLLTTDASVQTSTTSGLWSNSATDKVADIAGWRKKIFDQQEGYNPDTMILNPAQELNLLTDKNIRDALPREVGPGNPDQNSIISGRAVPILGLRQVLVTPQLAAGTVITMNAMVAGSIADEQPGANENYSMFDPSAQTGPFNDSGYEPQNRVSFAPVFVKTYRNENVDETIVRGARFPAMWLAEPKAVVVATGA